MKRLASLALALLFSSVTLCATDLSITFEVETKSLLGGKTSSEVHYYTPRFQMVRNEHARTDRLVDYEKATSYTIDHEQKKISMLRMEDALAALDAMEKQEPNTVSSLLAPMIGDPSECTVEAEGSEVVAGRTCTIYQIAVGKMLMTMSVDPSLVAPVPAASYARMMKASAASLAKAGPAAAAYKRLYEEMGRIKGIPLKTRMSGAMGMNATSEATQIKAGAIPSSLFALPAYPIEDLGKQLLKSAK